MVRLHLARRDLVRPRGVPYRRLCVLAVGREREID